MKAEYSYYADRPSLIIRGADFVKALQDGEEHYLLQIAVEGFGAQFGVVSHFDDRVNAAIQQWLDKSGNVIYTIKEKRVGRTIIDSWCEVYALNGTRLIQIVFSDDNGRNFIIRDEREAKTDE